MTTAGIMGASVVGPAGAAGAPAGGFGPTAEATGSVVQVVCYPEGPFRLCPVPIVDGHYPGYLPRTVPTATRIYVEGGEFVVFVTPNIAPYEEAVTDAAAAAAGYCGREAREQVVARITSRQRYAEEDLESWRFYGVCQ